MEKAYQQQNFQSILREHLEKVLIIYPRSIAKLDLSAGIPLGVKSDVLKHAKMKPKDEKKQGCKSTKQLIQNIGSHMVDSG